MNHITRIREILWSAGENFHGDEVFPANHSQRLTLKWNLDRTFERR